jgi:hypothetical protein
MEPTIKITITSATSKLSKHLGDSISDYNAYKYTYLKQLISRLRVVEQNIKDLSEEQQVIIIGNVFITERNIAAFAAEQYAALNQNDLFDSFIEIVKEIEELFKS